MTAAATETADTNYWLPLGLALALWMAAIAVGQLWQLADRGDGRGDMLEGDPPVPGTAPTPGHWIVESCREFDNRPCDPSGSNWEDSDAVGMIMQVEWRDFGGPAGSWNETAWTNMATTISTLKSSGKKYAIQPFFTSFKDASSCLTSNPTTNCDPMTPSYMWNDCATFGGDNVAYPNTRCSSYIGNGGQNIYIHKHIEGVRVGLQEWFEEIFARHGADADFEALFIPETTQSGGTPDSGFTATRYVQEGIKDIARRARLAMPGKAVYYMTNFVPYESQFLGDPRAFAQWAIDAHEVWISWPDTKTRCGGSNSNNTNAMQDWAKANYAKTPMLFPQQQSPNYQDSRVSCLANYPTNWLPSMYDFAVNKVDPYAFAWSTDFSESSNKTFTNLVQTILNSADANYPLPAP